MFNKKVILISGFSRGGTNIIWNILQSHPEICSAMYETHNLINDKENKIRRKISIFRKLSLTDSAILKSLVDYELYRLKMSNYVHESNKFIFSDIKYSRKQMKETALCLKSVDKAIELTDFLLGVYPGLYFISIVRNGYAVLEGHLRRGSSVQETGLLYQFIADKMKYYSEVVPNYKLFKFEEVLDDVFACSQRLFEFTDSQPVHLDSLRLKSKRILKSDGEHEVKYGQEKKKYWYDRNNIDNYFNKSINDIQIKNLQSKEIKEFNKYAKSALEYFSYDILH